MLYCRPFPFLFPGPVYEWNYTLPLLPLTYFSDVGPPPPFSFSKVCNKVRIDLPCFFFTSGVAVWLPLEKKVAVDNLPLSSSSPPPSPPLTKNERARGLLLRSFSSSLLAYSARQIIKCTSFLFKPGSQARLMVKTPFPFLPP